MRSNVPAWLRSCIDRKVRSHDAGGVDKSHHSRLIVESLERRQLLTTGALSEYWNSVVGTAVSNLTADTRYPASPTSSVVLPTLEAQTNAGDNYGQRLRAYVTPTQSGTYTFYVAGDDAAQLYLSSDADPTNKSAVASTAAWTGVREWTKYASQQSAPVQLQAGQRYYIEAVHKESSGGDSLAVGWSGPGIASPTVIAGSYLTAYAPPAVPAGPVSAAGWSFDETSGTTAADGTGNSRTLTLVGSSSFTAGRSGNALTLNGTNAYAKTASSPVLASNASFTVSAWINWNGATGNRAIISTDGVNRSAFSLQLRNGQPVLAVNATDATGTGASTKIHYSWGALSANTWHHVTGVYDAATSELRIYVNGVRQGSSVYNGVFNASGPTVVGAGLFNGLRADYFGGQIDDARAYATALTDAQAQQLYAGILPAQAAVPGVPEGLSAVPATGDGTKMVLSWSSDSAEATFSIQRDIDGVWTTVGTTPAGARTFTHSGLTAGTTYSYRIAAETAAGLSPRSSGVSATTQPAGVSGLTADWAFNQSSGSTSGDATGNNNTLTLVGGAGFAAGRPGRGNALTLNGAGRYAKTTSPALSSTGSYTVSAWVNWNGASGNRAIISADGTNRSAFNLQLRDGQPVLAVNTTDAAGTAASSVIIWGWSVLPANTWHHVAGVYDPSVGKVILYVDGVRQASANFAGSFNATGSTVVGAALFNGARADYFGGQIDDVGVYSTALAETQIKQAAGILVAAQPLGGNGVRLTWEKPAVAMTGYKILQSTDGQNFTEVGTAAGNAESALVEELDTSTVYHFKVVAVGSGGVTLSTIGPVAVKTGDVSTTGYYTVSVVAGDAANGVIPSHRAFTTNTGVTSTGMTINGGSGVQVYASDWTAAVYKTLAGSVSMGGTSYNFATSRRFRVETASRIAYGSTGVGLHTGGYGLAADDQVAGFEDLVDNDFNDYYFRVKATAIASVPGTGYQASFKFSTDNSAGVPGYITDIGNGYRDDSSGYAFGWVNASGSPIKNNGAFDNAPGTPSLLDSGISTYSGNSPLTWEAAVPNGMYFVKLVAGSPNTTSSNDYKYRVENSGNFLSASVAGGGSVTATGMVNVTDGRLSIYNVSGATGHTLAYVEITDAVARGRSVATNPADVVATAVNSTTVDVRWRDDSDNETAFRIDRSTQPDGNWIQVGMANANAGVFVDTLLNANTAYYYRVVALKGTTPAASATVAIVTPGGGGQLPYNATRTAWTTNKVIQAEDFDAGNATVAYIDDTTGNAGGAYRLTNVDVGYNRTDNRYFVGWTHEGDWTEYTVNTPTAGTYLIDASVASQGTGGVFDVTVNGTKVGELQIPDTASFNEYKYVATVPMSLSASPAHVVRVEARQPGASTAFLGDMDWLRINRFNAPSLTATAVSQTQVQLSWGNNADNLTGFKIQRRVSGTVNWGPEIASLDVTATTFTDSTATANTSYEYRIVGFLQTDLQIRYTTYGTSSAITSETAAATSNLPKVNLTVIKTTATEAQSTPGLIRISRTGPTTAALDVYIASFGYATRDLDYIGLPDKITIPIGATTYDLSVVPFDDLRTEGDESVDVQIISHPSYVAGSVVEGVVSIIDNESVTTPDESYPILGASGKSTTAITLLWRNRLTDVESWDIEASATGMPGSWTEIASSLPATDRMFDETGLTISTTRFYRISANLPGSSKVVSNIARASTLAVNVPTPPGMPTGLPPGTEPIVNPEPVGPAPYDPVPEPPLENPTPPITQPDPAPTTPPLPTATSPNAPLDLAVTIYAGSTNGASLHATWKDNSTNESGFFIETATDRFFNNILTSAVVGPNAQSHSFDGLDRGAVYFVRVKAYAGTAGTPSALASPWSNVAIAVTPVDQLEAKTATDTTIELKWRGKTSGGVEVVLERRHYDNRALHPNEPISEFTPVRVVTGMNAVTDTGLIEGTRYEYRLRTRYGTVYATDYQSVYYGYNNVAQASAYTLPARPTGLSASVAGKSGDSYGWLANYNLEWNDASGHEDGQYLEYSSDQNTWYGWHNGGYYYSSSYVPLDRSGTTILQYWNASDTEPRYARLRSYANGLSSEPSNVINLQKSNAPSDHSDRLPTVSNSSYYYSGSYHYGWGGTEGDWPEDYEGHVSRSHGIYFADGSWHTNEESTTIDFWPAGGTASADDDFSGVPDSVTVDSDESHATYSLDVVDDNLAEPSETASFDIKGSGDYIYYPWYSWYYGNTSSVSIVDDDWVDIDVDSNNTDGMRQPSRATLDEDEIEDSSSLPGKIIPVNDKVTNGSPGYYGYYYGDNPILVPVVAEYAPGLDWSKAKVRFVYDDSDPNDAQPTSSGASTYTPGPGTLRLWNGGTFVKSGEIQNSPPNNLMLEAVRPSNSSGDLTIRIEVAPDGSSFSLSDTIRVTAAKIDIDIDSDNNNAYNPPGRTSGVGSEEDIEDRPDRLGKTVAANAEDADNDKIPDFADGFDFSSDPADDMSVVENFVPVVLEIPDGLDLDKASFELRYADSNPADVIRTGAGTTSSPYEYEAGPGNLRLWTNNGTERDRLSVYNGGDFVPSSDGSQLFTASQWEALGFSGSNRTVTLYLEGIRAAIGLGSLRIEFIVDPDGKAEPSELKFTDAVRLSVSEHKEKYVVGDEISVSSKHRIDIHGVPLPDPSPTGDGESDRVPNMSYVDAYSLTPSFSTTDVAVPMPGDELLLEFRRTLGVDQDLKQVAGTNPDADRKFDSEQVLGAGWNTNIGSRIIVSHTSRPGENESRYRAVVYDEIGTALSYTGDDGDTYFADVKSTFSNAALKGSLKHDVREGDLNYDFVFTKQFGTKYYFKYIESIGRSGFGVIGGRTDSYYRLEKIVDRNGNALQYQYKAEAATLVEVIYDPSLGTAESSSRKIEFDYREDTLGWRLETVTDPLGREYSYEYDAAGLLAEVKKPEVQNPGQPAGSLIRPSVKFTYETWTELQTVYKSGSPWPDISPQMVTWTLPKTITDARDNVTSFSYVNRITPTGIRSENYASVYLSEKRPRISSVTTEDGTAYYDEEADRTLFRAVTKVVDTRGVQTVFTFGSGNAATQRVQAPNTLGYAVIVDQLTRAVNVTDANGAVSSKTVTFKYSNDINGNLTEVVDMSGNKVRYEYDSGVAGDAFNAKPFGDFYGTFYALYGQPAKSILAAGELDLTTQYRYDLSFNKLVKQIDAEGKAVRYALDSRGNRTQVIEAEGTPLQAIQKYAYNDRGFVTQMTDQDGRVTRYVPDGRGNLRYTIVEGQKAAGGAPIDLTPLVDTSAYPDVDSAAYYMVTQREADVMDRTLFEKDGHGNLTTYAYDNWDRVTEVTPPAGLSPTWDPLSGVPRQMASPNAKSKTAYDFNSNVVRKEDLNGNVTLFEYDDLNRLKVTRQRMAGANANDDAKDIITRLTYDKIGLLDTETNPNGRVTDHDYDELMRKIRTTLPPVTVVATPGDTNPSPATTTKNHVTEYFYGSNSGSGAFTYGGFNPTRVVDARNHAVDTEFDDAYRAVQTVRRSDDGSGLPSDADARGGEPATLIEYNKVQKPVKVTVLNEDGQGQNADRTSYTFYDERHRPTVTVTDMNGNGANLTAGSFVNDATQFTGDTADLVNRTTYDRAGNALTVTDAEGRTTTTVYDGASRPIQVKAPAVAVYEYVGGAQANFVPTMSTFYDAAGNVMQTVDTRGTRTAMEYDAQNRSIRTIVDLNGDGTFNPAVGPASADIVNWTGYDAAGNVIYSIDPNGHRTNTVYDRANRITQVESPQVLDAENGNAPAVAVTKTEYDKSGNVAKLTDPRGIVTETSYDELDRARFVTANATAAAGAADRLVTESRYDSNGNVVALVLHNRVSGVPQNQVTTYEFDDFDRRTKELLPAVGDGQSRQTVTAYSRAGDVLSVTDPKTQKVETDYDRAGRVTQQRFKRADGIVEETRVSVYDKAGNLKSRTDRHGQTAYDYDALNRVTLETRQTTTAGIEDAYSVASSYDKGGNRSKVVYPGSGRTLVSVYDRANRLTAVQDTAGAATPRVTTFAYDSAGNRTGSTAANGTVTAITFDAMNRVLTHGTKASAAAGAAPLYSVVYGYDLAGQRRTASETVATAGTRQINWDYDGLYRLTEESWTGDAAQTRSYTYDPAGNRLGRTVDYVDSAATDTTAAYAYDPLNRLTGYEEGDIAYDYGYDLNGNRTSLEKSMGGSGNYTYAYDTLNRLVSADANGTGFTAYYDARTRRLAKTEGTDTSATTLYRYDGGMNVQEVTPGVPAGSGTPAVPPMVKTELVRAGGLGGGIGSVLYTISGVTGNAEHFVYNAVGHTVATTDNAASITQATLYEAFGETAKQTGTGTNNRLRNTKERDQSIGLDNDGFRYYDPATGRYVQRDPIGYGDGMNVYASVHNNPINRVDPLGLSTDDDDARKVLEKTADRASGATQREKQAIRLGLVGAAQQRRLDNAISAINNYQDARQTHPFVRRDFILTPELQNEAESAAAALQQTKSAFIEQGLDQIDLQVVYSRGGGDLGRMNGIGFEDSMRIATRLLTDHQPGVTSEAGPELFAGAFLARIATMTAGAALGEASAGEAVTWRNGWRTADGKFASSRGAGLPGASAESAVWDAVANKPGWQVIRGRVSVRDASGTLRVYDGAAIPPGKSYGVGLEVKSGASPYNGVQRLFDSALNSSGSETLSGVGQNAGLQVRRALEIRQP